MTRAVAVALCLAACGRDSPQRAEPPSAPRVAGSAAESAAGSADPWARSTGSASSKVACSELPFAESTPVPEASGAAWLPGGRALLVISDSGRDGAYAIVDAATGDTQQQGKLPLGGPGDDLEGIAERGGKFYAISSPGWIRVYELAKGKPALVDGPYALGPIDLEEIGVDKVPAGTGMVCVATRTNCGRNYEGLCLAPPRAAGACIGFAASKADGHLYCIVERAGRLAVQHAPAIAVTKPGMLADCAFSEDGRLYAGSNTFDAGAVYRVRGWEDPARATVEPIAPLLVGFPETLAVRGDVIYRMSDTGRGPSQMKKYRCVDR